MSMSLLSSRSGYSASNAARFKPVFDKAYAERKNLVINGDTYCLSARTLQNRLSDALKWLIDFDKEQDKYLILRGMLRFKISSPSEVLLHFRGTLDPLAGVTEVETVKTNKDLSWRANITRFLESKEQTTVITAVHPDSKDIEYLGELKAKGLFDFRLREGDIILVKR